MDAHGKKIRKKRIVFKIGMSGKKKKKWVERWIVKKNMIKVLWPNQKYKKMTSRTKLTMNCEKKWVNEKMV